MSTQLYFCPSAIILFWLVDSIIIIGEATQSQTRDDHHECLHSHSEYCQLTSFVLNGFPLQRGSSWSFTCFVAVTAQEDPPHFAKSSSYRLSDYSGLK